MITNDISKEEWREYQYEDGYILNIPSPNTLYISDTGSHRVLDDKGVVHYILPGWRQLRWKPKNPDEAVQF